MSQNVMSIKIIKCLSNGVLVANDDSVMSQST